MDEVVEFLKKNKTVYFATIGLDGRPKVRPFGFMLEDGGRLFFCTSNQKNVFREMQEHPHIELCAPGEDYSWLRLSGKAVFSKDLALKAKVLNSCPLVTSIYKTPDNPAFEIFHLEGAVATIADFSGNPPKTYTL